MNTESNSRDCPYCKEEIKAEAIKCKHCGSSVAPERPSHGGTCPYCKEQIQPEAIRCKHCKSDLRAPQDDHRGCGCQGRSQALPVASYMWPTEGLPQATPESFADFPPGATDARGIMNSGGSLTARLSLGGTSLGTSGGGLAAWGCWESTCCEQWGLCCLPTPRGRMCWTCCTRSGPCTRCIWPW